MIKALGMRRALAIFFAPVFSLMLFAAYVYSPHLTWKIQEARLQLHGSYESPTRTMPKSTLPPMWVEVHIGGQSMYLPSAMAKRRQDPLSNQDGILFDGSEQDILVFSLMHSDPSSDQDLIKASQIHPNAKEFTWPSLRYELYKASVADFRWSMSSKEVAWHSYCMSFRPDLPGQKAEVLIREDLEGLLVVEETKAFFDWQSKTCPLSGKIVFVGKMGKLELEFVRAVCQSFQLDCPAAQAEL